MPIFALGTCSFESGVQRMGYCIPMTELIAICATVEEYFRINLRASPFLASTQTQRAVICLLLIAYGPDWAGARAMYHSALMLRHFFLLAT